MLSTDFLSLSAPNASLSRYATNLSRNTVTQSRLFQEHKIAFNLHDLVQVCKPPGVGPSAPAAIEILLSATPISAQARK